MKEEFVNDVLRDMLAYLDNGQAEQLRRVLNHNLSGFEIQRNEKSDIVAAGEENSQLTKAFLSAKRIEGCSEKSLTYYRKTIETMIEKIGKGITHITTNDLRSYLTDYQAEKKSSKVTIDNIRRILSSFFSWLEDEDYILKSPVRRIHKVKTATTIKETYTDEALETMRDNCETLRDLAMIDMLASTGMRVGELVLLNRDDINFEERECVVFGKGSKERMVYFDARTKIHLQNYLAQRTDSNIALFVSLKAPYERLQIGGVETRLRELGKRLSLPRVHPHKFRRTLATMAIDKGMPVEQLQRLLGHQRIDTTLQYAMVKQSNVKIAHRKYIG
ncbi:site-specific tyrosine recombinase/integron integrase [Mediterraneibacter gnavus]|uniref:Tyrosine-type recombinase/integrase n=2 Tax=root TaxID=1 RepID=A0A9X3HG79_MEDGN|nr:site-specific tyrosine recombinase/integron integrase [Mediterraneibacter gnavus]MCZ7694396.1 tyrosine-type recombinase/integrase [Mediterraneibacter gnavus]MDC6148365.1 tyrosine-type recombinase/integrase [Mediterraneibacter gnavus]MDE1201782.1 tyrosine-type recombinase/integrase [Mediterraneibacter gnavus]